MPPPRLRPAACALAAAALFGLSVPASKVLLDGRGLSPPILAGLLYLAAGGTLWAWRGVRRTRPSPLPGRVRALVAAVALVGGVAGPLALLYGLERAEGQVASLLLALEGGMTALLAAAFFREHVGGRAWGAVALAAAGAVVLAEPWAAEAARPDLLGVALVAGATLCWALDNNLSRALSERDAVQVVSWKGMVAGPISLGLGLALGGRVPGEPALLGGALAVGALSYGLSLVLILRAFSGLGAARAMAVFASAPAFGAVGSWVALGETPGPALALAAPLLAASLWMLREERHEHPHEHLPLEHEHEHCHDEHHRHDHRGDEGPGPHTHRHRHERLVHSHPHAPDLHHRHGHGGPP